MFRLRMFVLIAIVWLTALCGVAQVPADYFAEPANLPFAEEVQERGQENGWHWTEFRYTSLIYQGEAIRVHAVYAVPDAATAANKVPAILMTHGKFGAVRGSDKRYWSAVTTLASAGYAVLFFDWYPDFAKNWKPATPDEAQRFTTFGKLNYFTPAGYWLPGNDWKDSISYQVAMAAKRGVSWLLAQPEVDGTRIGVTGASFGGIFSSMIAGIDTRIAAANPCVYTSGFGIGEPSYDNLPKDWTAQQVAEWKARFDSQELLKQRSIPILYMIGVNDTVFPAKKAMTCFAAMNEPKSLLMGLTEGHGFWPPEQTLRFFDSVFKGVPRATVHDMRVADDGRNVAASVQTTGEVRTVEFFFTANFEQDPDAGTAAIPAEAWKWVKVDATKADDGRYTVRWPLPLMRPINGCERLYRWGEADVLDLAQTQKTASQPGEARVFVRITDAHGAMACTPFSTPLYFGDPLQVVKNIPHTMPQLTGAVRVKAKMAVEVTPDVPAGQPAAMLDIPLPVKAVGTKGYILWNWRQQAPSATLTSDGVATPTKKLLAPFADSIPADTFQGGKKTADFGSGGLLTYRIHSKDGVVNRRDGWHGAVVPEQGGTEAITLQAQDDAEHRLTLVMGAPSRGECNVRVSLQAPDGAVETVQYHQAPGADHVLQFTFTGTATLRIAITSYPQTRPFTHIGPSALFLD